MKLKSQYSAKMDDFQAICTADSDLNIDLIAAKDWFKKNNTDQKHVTD